MTEVVGIRYEESNRVVYVTPSGSYEVGDFVVIRQKKGTRLARVVLSNKDIASSKLPAEMEQIIRRAGKRDMQDYQENMALAETSFDRVKELIANQGLKMTLIDIVFPLERSYVLITFSSEGRVDFRSLLKDLASYFKTRIELRQLNDREEAKVFGGLGPCGRSLCCASFLGEFPPVSIKMVKNQGLSLNSGKTTGVCGRLMCCLSFEDDFYTESKLKFPDLGTQIETADGPGIVVGIDVFAQTLKIRLKGSHRLLTYTLEEVECRG